MENEMDRIIYTLLKCAIEKIEKGGCPFWLAINIARQVADEHYNCLAEFDAELNRIIDSIE